MLPISAVIIANHNYYNIIPTLKSLAEFVEIIILFSDPLDKTAEIIKSDKTLNQSPINIQYHDWQGFGPQKQLATKLTSNNWVFAIDTDEVISSQLLDEIKKINLKNSENNPTIYRIRRINYFANNPLFYGEGGNDYLIRLFHKNLATWSDDLVHEKIITSSNCKITTLKGILKHYSATNIKEYINKQKKYGEIAAERIREQNLIIIFIRMIFSPVFRFVRFYFFKLGFLDRVSGLMHILIGCYASFNKYKIAFKKNLM